MEESRKQDDAAPPFGGRCSRFCAEFSMSFFSTSEIGLTLDVDRCFRVRKHTNIIVKIFKFLLWGLGVASFAWAWVDYAHPDWFMAYISHWTMLYMCTYETFSMMTSLVSNPYQWTIKATWLLFSLASVHGIMVVLLYWFTEYDPDISPLNFTNIMIHGGTYAAIMIDGLIINRTPIRLKHYFFVLLFGLLFVGWTLVQGLVPVDNPFTEGMEDEALYNILDWQNDVGLAVGASVGTCFVAMPFFQVVYWFLSLCGRYYIDDSEEGAADPNHYDGDIETPVIAQTY